MPDLVTVVAWALAYLLVGFVLTVLLAWYEPTKYATKGMYPVSVLASPAIVVLLAVLALPVLALRIVSFPFAWGARKLAPPAIVPLETPEELAAYFEDLAAQGTPTGKRTDRRVN